ncbi:MAG: hypothetical protein R3B96_17910 [Pirellulaceae bacterium]
MWKFRILIGLAAGLIAINGLRCRWRLQLKPRRPLIVASVRTVDAVAARGARLLESVFRIEGWPVVLAAAGDDRHRGLDGVGENKRTYPGIWVTTLVSVWASSWLITSFALLADAARIDVTAAVRHPAARHGSRKHAQWDYRSGSTRLPKHWRLAENESTRYSPSEPRVGKRLARRFSTPSAPE